MPESLLPPPGLRIVSCRPTSHTPASMSSIHKTGRRGPICENATEDAHLEVFRRLLPSACPIKSPDRVKGQSPFGDDSQTGLCCAGNLPDISSEIEYRIRLRSCAKEPETVEWIEHFVKGGDVLYDVGANVGAYSLVAAKATKGTATVYAFEPSIPTFAQLCRNVLLNDCGDSVIPLPTALSELECFQLCYAGGRGSLHNLVESIDYNGEQFTPVRRQVLISYRMDDLVSEFLPVPNHVKLDVDGIDLAILRGAQQTLGNRALRSLLVEVNEKRSGAGEIVSLLSNRGFVLHSRHKTEGDGTFNLIVVRP